MGSIRSRIALLGATLLGGFAIGASCTTHVTNEAHCFYHEGNATCAERYGNELPFCGTVCLDRDGNPPSPNGDGCVDFAPEPGCYSPCGDSNDVTDDESCLDTAETGTDSLTTSGPTTTVGTEPTQTSTTPTSTDSSSVDTTVATSTGPSGCAESSECADANLPICLDSVCTACVDADEPDAACAAKDAAFGVCGNDGVCVQCTASNHEACTDTTPACDDTANTCVGCTEHAQCGEDACAFETGECLGGCHLEVDGDGGADTTSIQAAVDMVDDGSDCTIVVNEDSGGVYGTVVIDGGKRIGLLGGAGAPPRLLGISGASIEVSAGSVLYARGLDIRGNADDFGISISGADAYVDACQIVQNAGGGIRVTSSGYLRLRNSMVGLNGSQFAATRGIYISSGGADILYSSLVADDGNTGADALGCAAGADVTIRNSIALGADAPSVSCAGIEADDTASDAMLSGTGNDDVGDLNPSWFVNVGGGNFHLSVSGGTTFDDIAQWQAGDPAADIDGDARPNVDGTMDYPGADVL